MSDNPPLRKQDREAAAREALVDSRMPPPPHNPVAQVKRSKVSAESPEIKKARLAQSTTSVIATAKSSKAHHVASGAVDRVSSACDGNGTDDRNALATANAALKEAETRVAVGEKALREVRVAIERARRCIGEMDVVSERKGDETGG